MEGEGFRAVRPGLGAATTFAPGLGFAAGLAGPGGPTAAARWTLTAGRRRRLVGRARRKKKGSRGC